MNSSITFPLVSTQVLPVSRLLEAEHILLLQGPLGSFFQNFSHWLNNQNIRVSKINFNGGDWFYSRHINSFNFNEPLANFYVWLDEIVKVNQIDAIVCFGDCRPQHQIAKQVCESLDIDFFVFEEGYIRPDYITFEYQGVNGNSSWSHDDTLLLPVKVVDPINAHQKFIKMVGFAIAYYIAMSFGKLWFAHYKHHRNTSTLSETKAWLISGYRRLVNIVDEAKKMNFIQAHLKDKYFICALQVFNDYQVRVHSQYNDVTEFINEVIISFAGNADKSTYLVFKHHPMDRGYRNYEHFINELTKKFGIEDRVYYVCDVHLPTLIEHSLGMVTINSTTGLQSLFRHKPVKALGTAIYNLNGVSSQLSLNRFWREYITTDMSKYPLFKDNLIYFTQLNGSFYGEMPWMDDRYKYKNKSKNIAPINSKN